MGFPTYLSKSRPSAFHDFCESDWVDRHHLVASAANDILPREQRIYFDLLPNKGAKELDGAAAKDAGRGEVQRARLRKVALWWQQSRAPTWFQAPCRGELTPHMPRKAPTPRRISAVQDALNEDDGINGHRPGSKCSTGVAKGSGGSGGSRSTRRSTATTNKHAKEAVFQGHAHHFAFWCAEKHSHLLNLWRKLDKDGSLSLTKQEFMRGIRELKYDGDIEELWERLDMDGSGMVSLLEFAPEQALELAQFKKWACETFGTVTSAFRAMDKNRNGRVSFEEFAAACTGNGLPDHLHASLQAIFTLTSDSNKCASIASYHLNFLDRWEPPAYLFASPDHCAKSRLRKVLVRKHGNNALLAFRKALDRDSSMRVSYEEFAKLCRDISRRNNFMELSNKERITSVFCSFDGHRSGWFGLIDWDEDAYKLLQSFLLWVRGCHGTVQQFVKDKEEVQGIGISVQEFRRSTVKGLDLGMEAVVTLIEGITLEAFQSAHGFRNIFTRDVAFLDRWDPEKESGDKHMWEQVTNQVRLLDSKHAKHGV